MFFPAAVKLFQQEVTKNIGIGGAGFCLELVKNALCHNLGFFALGQARAFFKYPVEVENLAQTRQGCGAGFVLAVHWQGCQRAVHVVQHIAHAGLEGKGQLKKLYRPVTVA